MIANALQSGPPHRIKNLCFLSSPGFASRDAFHIPFNSVLISTGLFPSNKALSPSTSWTRQSLFHNCRLMRGLRSLIPPPALWASSRLYSTLPKHPITMAGKTKTDMECAGSLPPLSASDFRAYNRMSEQMEGFVGGPFSHFCTS